jgi:CO/xanthine dehydrogenase FAD-binding subunit
VLAGGGAGALEEAAATCARELEIYGDRAADQEYRRGLVQTLTRRALADALETA